MSAPDPPPPPPPGDTSPCPRCGAPVGPGQDWCLNCGAAATTQVAGATGWRTPLVIVAIVLVLATGGLVFAFLQLSDDDDTPVASAPAPTATTPPVTGASGPSGPTDTETATPSPTTTGSPTGASGPSGPDATEEPDETATPDGPSGTPPGIPSTTPSPTSTSTSTFPDWPAGKTAYTVIVYSGKTKAQAEAKAKSVSGLSGLGILHSNDYSSLRAGYWVVFSGQYDTVKAAAQASEAAQSSAPGNYPKQVKPK